MASVTSSRGVIEDMSELMASEERELSDAIELADEKAAIVHVIKNIQVLRKARRCGSHSRSGRRCGLDA